MTSFRIFQIARPKSFFKWRIPRVSLQHKLRERWRDAYQRTQLFREIRRLLAKQVVESARAPGPADLNLGDLQRPAPSLLAAMGAEKLEKLSSVSVAKMHFRSGKCNFEYFQMIFFLTVVFFSVIGKVNSKLLAHKTK